jgi:hypothetical protein
MPIPQRMNFIVGGHPAHPFYIKYGVLSFFKGKPGYLSESEKAEIILWLSQREMWDLAELAII